MQEYRGYLYTVVTIANRAPPHTEEAELWWGGPTMPTVRGSTFVATLRRAELRQRARWKPTFVNGWTGIT